MSFRHTSSLKKGSQPLSLPEKCTMHIILLFPDQVSGQANLPFYHLLRLSRSQTKFEALGSKIKSGRSCFISCEQCSSKSTGFYHYGLWEQRSCLTWESQYSLKPCIEEGWASRRLCSFPTSQLMAETRVASRRARSSSSSSKAAVRL